MDDDFQNSGAYQYFFGEAVEITKRIEEYRREHGRIDDYPVPAVLEMFAIDENIVVPRAIHIKTELETNTHSNAVSHASSFNLRSIT
ncbi:unnamed protein product [Microthlaspi erraticum]|uniref:Uncharacterized protein n=1 Tax=Microthlaspi erraticum TaxID=1685480 RepID=A0A6D2IDL9_9BRAS|nr:unnamed protein product [Microthlaspi erraticum]